MSIITRSTLPAPRPALPAESVRPLDREAVSNHAKRQAEYARAEYARAEARRWTDVAEAFDRVAERYANPMKETENDSEAA